MPLLAFKLSITPLLIGSVTLAGRKWGAAVSGLLIGLPLTSGPVSFLLAYEFGVDFARISATGSLIGQVALCVFCLTYTLSARKLHWFFCTLISSLAFLLTIFAANHFSWQLLPAFFSLVVTIILILKFFPRYPVLNRPPLSSPRWDLPGRIIVATSFVIILTAVADQVGAQLSGMLAPFPIFSIVFACFTQAQQGVNATASLLKGIVQGSFSNGLFFLVVGLFLAPLGLFLTYLLATLVSVCFGALTYRVILWNKSRMLSSTGSKS